MDYPQRLTLKQLESRHPEYQRLAPLYQTIDDLVSGGHAMVTKKRQYLKRRPGEEQELYETRIERFAYTNVLGQSIAAQVGKLSSGAVSIEDAGEETSDDFWEDFRGATDKRRQRSERELLESIFRTILKFGCGYLQVEKPAAPVTPLNRAQEEQLGLLPYLCLHSPLNVPSWGESDAGLQWIKLRQLTEESDPFEGTRTIATWRFVDAAAIATYQAEVRLAANGKIKEIKQGGEWVGAGEQADVTRSSLIAHGFGRLPVIKIEVPHDLWTCNTAYLTALQAMDLENSRYDAGIMSYVQRTYKPVLNPDMDLDQSFVDSDDPIKSGNAYILKADGFEFNESQGRTVETIGAYVEELHDRIRGLFGQQSASATKGALEQSGISKKMDFVAQEVLLRAYGAILVDVYQEALRMVAIAAGRPERPSVSGLDSFDVDSLEALYEIAQGLDAIRYLVPPTAIKLFAKQLTGMLIKRVSESQQAEIDEEIEAMFEVMDLEPDDRPDESPAESPNA